MTRKQGLMDLGLYQKVMDEVALYSEPIRSKEIELYHFGESLLHPELDKMIEYASSRKLNVSLSVNAPQLTPMIAEKILKKHPCKIIVSLDGYDEASYQAIRGKNADFSKAVDNIEKLVSLHQQMESHTQICVCMIKLHINEKHTAIFTERWRKLGIAVDIRGFFPWGDKQMVGLGEFQQYPPRMPCPFPWQYLVVQWNGDVVPCCRDYNGINVMGNVKHASLKAIWNGPAFTEFRQQMTTGQYSPSNSICAECLSIYCH